MCGSFFELLIKYTQTISLDITTYFEDLFSVSPSVADPILIWMQKWPDICHAPVRTPACMDSWMDLTECSLATSWWLPMRSWMDSAILVLPLVMSIICLLITFTLEAIRNDLFRWLVPDFYILTIPLLSEQLESRNALFADFDVPPSQWQKATGGFDMLGSGRTRSRRRKGRQIWLQPSLFRVLYTYRVSQRTIFLKLSFGTEERWKEFKNDPFKDWSRNSSRTQCWSGSQSDQNCFAQHWRCRQWMPIKEIGRRDCKICRAADFSFVYLSSFIGLDIFAWLQSLPDIARHCDTARIKHMCVWWILRLLFSVCQDQPHLHFRAILCPCN